jgi:hypothetical protein
VVVAVKEVSRRSIRLIPVVVVEVKVKVKVVEVVAKCLVY